MNKEETEKDNLESKYKKTINQIHALKFNNIEFEFVTFLPPLDPSAQVITICDGNGNTIGVNKPTWRLYDYNFDLTVMEERYNILTFTSGNAGLMYAR